MEQLNFDVDETPEQIKTRQVARVVLLKQMLASSKIRTMCGRPPPGVSTQNWIAERMGLNEDSRSTES